MNYPPITIRRHKLKKIPQIVHGPIKLVRNFYLFLT